MNVLINDKYQICSVLRKSPHSVVFEATALNSGSRHAIKMLSKQYITQSQHRLTMMQREIDILKRLDHENCVCLNEVIEEEEHFYLVMEFAAGNDLFDFISSQGRASEFQTSIIFHQLLLALEYCHNILKIIHHDVKLENLRFSDSRNIKVILLDFGLTIPIKTNDYSIDSGTLCCGTPEYTPPEAFESSSTLIDGSKCDIWSAGVLLYALLCARLPFEGQGDVLVSKILDCNSLIFPSFLSPAAQDLISQLLSRFPVDRPSISEIRQHPFMNQFSSEGTRILPACHSSWHEINPFEEEIISPQLRPANDFSKKMYPFSFRAHSTSTSKQEHKKHIQQPQKEQHYDDEILEEGDHWLF